MTKETYHIPISQEQTRPDRIKLTKRGKVVAGMLAVSAAFGTYGASKGLTGEQDSSKEPNSVVSATAKSTVEFGGEISGWGQGTATRALRGAIMEGANEISTTVDIDMDDALNQPVYNQAREVLDQAGYHERLPDTGDTLTVKVKTSADEDGDVSYKVLKAYITDVKEK